MILLDTDHLSVVSDVRHSAHVRLVTRLREAGQTAFATAVVSVEEQCRGWLARINRMRDVHQQVYGYERLRNLFKLLADWEIAPFNEQVADEFKRLRQQKVRIGTQDLKIACIALAHNALLLSANLNDFRQVPGLRVENWLQEAPAE